MTQLRLRGWGKRGAPPDGHDGNHRGHPGSQCRQVQPGRLLATPFAPDGPHNGDGDRRKRPRGETGEDESRVERRGQPGLALIEGDPGEEPDDNHARTRVKD